MSADLRAVADPDAFDPPGWARRYVFDINGRQSDRPCPACGDPVDFDLDGRLISLAARGGQRLCEECLDTEVPAALMLVAGHIEAVHMTIRSLDGLGEADRAAVQLCAITLTEWLARRLREAIA